MKRGEVRWADFPPPMGRRPVVLVSRNEAYSVRAAVTVAPVFGKIRGIPTEVVLEPEDGMPKMCAVNADSLTTIAKARVLDKMCELSDVKLRQLDRAIRFALNL